MAFDTNRGWASGAAGAEIDLGLRRHMLKVYNTMAGGTALTGLVAALLVDTGAVDLFFSLGPRGASLNALGWLALLAPFLMILGLGVGIGRVRASTAAGLFWGVSALMGVSLAPVFLEYTGASLARVFFVTAASFGGLSLWGYTTRRPLDALGSFMVMGLWGLVVAGLVNVFLQSPAVYFVTSVAAVIVFAGLTAWDTQKIKDIYDPRDDAETAGKKAVLGALSLYLDFVNMFMALLRFFGDRR
jgi:FtsH-binding integral membrane protein